MNFEQDTIFQEFLHSLEKDEFKNEVTLPNFNEDYLNFLYLNTARLPEEPISTLTSLRISSVGLRDEIGQKLVGFLRILPLKKLDLSENYLSNKFCEAMKSNEGIFSLVNLNVSKNYELGMGDGLQSFLEKLSTCDCNYSPVKALLQPNSLMSLDLTATGLRSCHVPLLSRIMEKNKGLIILRIAQNAELSFQNLNTLSLLGANNLCEWKKKSDVFMEQEQLRLSQKKLEDARANELSDRNEYIDSLDARGDLIRRDKENMLKAFQQEEQLGLSQLKLEATEKQEKFMEKLTAKKKKKKKK
eukprot:snap_masked-scaffold_3-processed-gene-5.13-mRNA-1 protein AED:1.00 eAED:1.00 QI:0/-1/0/0/-1/1/1/0/300